MLNFITSKIKQLLDGDDKVHFANLIRLLKIVRIVRYGGTPESDSYLLSLTNRTIKESKNYPFHNKEHILSYAISRMA